MAEWPACRTHNQAVPGLSLPLWPLDGFALDHPQFKSLAMLVNNQLVVFCQLEFLILLSYGLLFWIILSSKYLSGVPVTS